MQDLSVMLANANTVLEQTAAWSVGRADVNAASSGARTHDPLLPRQAFHHLRCSANTTDDNWK